MPDGGSVAIDFEDLPFAQDLPMDSPVVILLPGKHYKTFFETMLHLLRSSGFRVGTIVQGWLL